MFAQKLNTTITNIISLVVSGNKVSEPVYQEIDLSVYNGDLNALYAEFMADGKFELIESLNNIYDFEQAELAAKEQARVNEFNRVEFEIAYSRAIELELSASNWY